jgi:hypothetical protein
VTDVEKMTLSAGQATRRIGFAVSPEKYEIKSCTWRTAFAQRLLGYRDVRVEIHRHQIEIVL